MKWTQNKSIRLSMVSIVLFWAVLIAVCIAAPWIITGRMGREVEQLPYYMMTVYSAAALIALVLERLYRLLANIRKGLVFSEDNVRYLRNISWCCIFAGLILFVSGFYDFWFFVIAAFAAFVGLIVRVVKNVFEEAVLLKAENDFTI